MKTRCPFVDCKSTFEVHEELGFGVVQCPNCSSRISVRSIERYEAVEKVVKVHQERGTLFSLDTFSALQPLPRIVVLLEDIRSLWNVGSMFRTADGAGCEHLILTGITGYPPRKEIEKTSLGAESVIGWTYASHSMEVLPFIKELGYQILSLEKDERSVGLTQALDEQLIRMPLCIVVGNEVTGLYHETLGISDLICHLPMRGMKTSLNVAVAFGIASYQITEKLLT